MVSLRISFVEDGSQIRLLMTQKRSRFSTGGEKLAADLAERALKGWMAETKRKVKDDEKGNDGGCARSGGCKCECKQVD